MLTVKKEKLIDVYESADWVHLRAGNVNAGCGVTRGKRNTKKQGSEMDDVFQSILGKTKRVALPAHSCSTARAYSSPWQRAEHLPRHLQPFCWP